MYSQSQASPTSSCTQEATSLPFLISGPATQQLETTCIAQGQPELFPLPCIAHRNLSQGHGPGSLRPNSCLLMALVFSHVAPCGRRASCPQDL